jgi:ABC-type Fe3+-hydroxamate transport system substrate-binding protein
VVVGYAPGDLSSLTVAGHGTFLQEILDHAGAVNVISQQGYPVIGREALLRLDPVRILDFQARGTDAPAPPEEVLQLWSGLPALQAVRLGHVYYRAGQDHVVAGPRLATGPVLADFAAMLAGTAPRALVE